MIEEIPEIPRDKEEEEGRSLMEEVKEIENMMKPEVIYSDEIKIESPSENYKVRANVVVSIMNLIKKTEQPIKPFSVTYTVHENAITREVYSSWGEKLKMTPVKAKVSCHVQG